MLLVPADPQSLSQAGGEFLAKLGVPPSAVHGDDLNERYKGDAGVYGMAGLVFQVLKEIGWTLDASPELAIAGVETSGTETESVT